MRIGRHAQARRVLAGSLAWAAIGPAGAAGQVLQVGTYNGGSGPYTSNDYPDFSSPGATGRCSGGEVSYATPPPYDRILGPLIPCMFPSSGNRIEGNQLQDNGGFGNPTNGDLANLALPNAVDNCLRGNTGSGGGRPSTAPRFLQSAQRAGTCGAPWAGAPAQIVPLMLQVLCAAYGPASGACLSGLGYPRPSGAVLMPIPQEPGMIDPCAGVPANSWCPR